MFKKVIAMLLMSIMVLSGTVMSFAEEKDERLGGGSSHQYFQVGGEKQDEFTRGELSRLKRDMKEGNDSEAMDLMLYVLGIFGIDIFIGDIDRPTQNSIYEIEEALETYPTTTRFKVHYKEYACEVPGYGYAEITRIRPLS